MTESKLWSYLRKTIYGTDPRADATRHEDRLSIGCPDTSLCYFGVDAWIELKCEPPWGESGYVRISELKPLQINWMEARGEAGSVVGMLAAFGEEAFLIPWWNVRATYRAQLTYSDLSRLCVGSFVVPSVIMDQTFFESLLLCRRRGNSARPGARRKS